MIQQVKNGSNAGLIRMGQWVFRVSDDDPVVMIRKRWPKVTKPIMIAMFCVYILEVKLFLS